MPNVEILGLPMDACGRNLAYGELEREIGEALKSIEELGLARRQVKLFPEASLRVAGPQSVSKLVVRCDDLFRSDTDSRWDARTNAVLQRAVVVLTALVFKWARQKFGRSAWVETFVGTRDPVVDGYSHQGARDRTEPVDEA